MASAPRRTALAPTSSPDHGEAESHDHTERSRPGVPPQSGSGAGRSDLPAAAWNLLKESTSEFVADDGLSRGASIAFYSVTSLPPVLIIVIAIAGIAFGEDAA